MSDFYALVVDDDPTLGNLFATVLRESGITTDTLTDGRQTIAQMVERTPDLLTVDLQMPGISGIDILKAVRADPRFRDTRIMVITASSESSYHPDLQELADLVLMKPVTFDQVSSFAKRLLPMARRSQETTLLSMQPESGSQTSSKS